MTKEFSDLLIATIKDLRIKKKLTQEQMAFEINISTSYLGMIERGERNLSLKNICEIAKLFNMKPSELLGFAENKLNKGDTW